MRGAGAAPGARQSPRRHRAAAAARRRRARPCRPDAARSAARNRCAIATRRSIDGPRSRIVQGGIQLARRGRDATGVKPGATLPRLRPAGGVRPRRSPASAGASPPDRVGHALQTARRGRTAATEESTSFGRTSGIDGVRSSYDGIGTIAPSALAPRGPRRSAGASVRPRRRRSRAVVPAHSSACAPAIVERDRDAAGAAGDMVGAEQQRHGVAAFDHARDPHPGRVRELPQRGTGGHPRDRARPRRSRRPAAPGSSPSARDRRCAGFANPQQPREIEAGGAADTGSKRSQVSTSATTSPRAAAAAAMLHEQRGPARRARADHSDSWPAPQPAAKRGIDGRRSGRRDPVVVGLAARAPAVVSVTSSLRARSRDSSSARAASIISLFLRLATEYRRVRFAGSRQPLTYDGQ